MIRIITIIMMLLWSPDIEPDSLGTLYHRIEPASNNDYAEHILSFNDLGHFYYSRNMFIEACESYIKAESLINISSKETSVSLLYSTYTGYARALIALGQYKEVENLLNKALELECSKEERGEIFGIFADYYLKTGNLNKAETYYDKFVSYSPASNSSNLLRMRLYRAEKNYSGALGYEKLLRKGGYPKHLVLMEVAGIYQDMGNYEKANQYLYSGVCTLDSLRVIEMINDLESISKQIDLSELQLQKEKNELKTKNRTIWVVSLIGITLLALISIIVVLLITKITLSKKLITSQKELSKALSRIQEESSTKTNFLKNLSSGIRKPLNEILSLSDSLSRKVKDDIDFPKYSNVIHESSDQLVKLVNDSVDISDYDLERQHEFTYIKPMVKDAVNYMDIPLRRGVSIKYDIPSDYQEISIQRAKVVKILSNLIHNAAKFTVSGTITIKCLKSEDSVEFSVTDTGCGIPINQQEYVFDYFTKLDTMCQGLGLGLPLSKLLAESMNGRLFIDSTYTSGCRMILILPFEKNTVQ